MLELQTRKYCSGVWKYTVHCGRQSASAMPVWFSAVRTQAQEREAVTHLSTLSQKRTPIYIIYVALHSAKDTTRIHQMYGTCYIQDLTIKLEDTLPTHREMWIDTFSKPHSSSRCSLCYALPKDNTHKH